MTDAVRNFIVEQANERAKAAAVLADSLDINGIIIGTGCDDKGIFVITGLDKLAEITGYEIFSEPADSNGRYKRYITIEGTRFYEHAYEERKTINDTEEF